MKDLGQVKPSNRELQISVSVRSQGIKVEIPNNVEWLGFFKLYISLPKSNMSHYICHPQN